MQITAFTAGFNWEQLFMTNNTHNDGFLGSSARSH